MNKTKTLLIAAFAAVAVAIGATTYVLVNQPAQTNNNQQTAEQPKLEEKNDNLVSFTAEAGKTVLDQTKANATVVVKDSAYGPFVDTINGKAGGTDGKYWAFYVDGAMAQVGAGEFVTKGGEKVEWKFE